MCTARSTVGWGQSEERARLKVRRMKHIPPSGTSGRFLSRMIESVFTHSISGHSTPVREKNAFMSVRRFTFW